MKSSFRPERLLDLGRAVLLLSSVLALATAAVWAWRPEWVDDFDQRKLAARVDGPVEQLEELEELLLEDRGSPEFRGALEQLLEDIGPVRWGDLLGETRRRALAELAGSHERAGEHDAALARLEQLVEFDPKGLVANLDLARNLGRREERREEARERLARLQRLAPEDVRVAQACVDRLVADGELERAIEVALEHDLAARTTLWRIYYRSNPKATDTQALVSPRLGADGVLRLAVAVAGPVSNLRVQLPELLAMRFEDPVLTVRFLDQTHTYRLVEMADLTGLSATGTTLTSSGWTNALIDIEIRRSQRAELTELLLEAPFEWGVSPVLAGLAEVPGVFAALSQPGAGVDPIALARLRESRFRAVAASSFEVFWSSGEQVFDGKRRAAAVAEIELRADEPGFDFQVTFELGRKADRLRLDLPPEEGTSWELAQLELVLEEETLALDPAALVLEATRDVQRDGARFQVEGGDPWLTFAVPGGQRRVQAVRVAGIVR